MKKSILILLLLINWQEMVFSEEHSQSCKKTAAVYDKKLINEIQKGIPIEVVGVVTSNEAILCKNTFRITYDLWEENADINFEGQVSNQLQINNIAIEICQKMKCLNSFFSASLKPTATAVQFRLLLNPMWEGRANKYLKNNPRFNEIKMYHFNAQTIAKDLPSDIVLYYEELKK